MRQWSSTFRACWKRTSQFPKAVRAPSLWKWHKAHIRLCNPFKLSLTIAASSKPLALRACPPGRLRHAQHPSLPHPPVEVRAQGAGSAGACPLKLALPPEYINFALARNIRSAHWRTFCRTISGLLPLATPPTSPPLPNHRQPHRQKPAQIRLSFDK